MSDYGVKISLPNKDVSSGNINDFALDSKYDIYKTYILGTGSLTLSTEASTQTNHQIISVPHNLGYKPQCIWYWSTGGDYSLDFWLGSKGPPYSYGMVNMNIDGSNFQLNYLYHNIPGNSSNTNLAPITLNFKYYIFIEQGN
jgi:hypothetical protein